jgi:hypothetical protein
MHNQQVEHNLILRVPQGDKGVMNLSSVSQQHWQSGCAGKNVTNAPDAKHWKQKLVF